MLAVIGLALASVGFGACTPLRMAAPSDVQAESEAFEAKGRSWGSGLLVDESFQIGPFSVKEVDRSATSGRGTSRLERVGWFAFQRTDREELQGGYAFQFQEGEAGLRAECRTFTSRKTSSRGSWEVSEQSSRLACACAGGNSEATLDLHLSGREPTGTVTLAGRTLEMTSIRSTKGTWDTAEPVGFRVDGPQGPVGAVEVLRPGQLWLSRKLDAEERRELACLLAGVMLNVEE